MSHNQINLPENQYPENEQSGIREKTVQLFFKTGGEQPKTIGAKKINLFFQGNCAKSWAMKDGFISTFKSYKGGKIIFQMITDPRFKGDHGFLSQWIARQYKKNVDVLKDASSYEAHHFIANDIVGFLIYSNPPGKVLMELLDKRIKKAMETLPKKPKEYHYGKIG